MHLDDPDGVIGDFLGGGPRAAEWRELWQTLKDRLLAAKERVLLKSILDTMGVQ